MPQLYVFYEKELIGIFKKDEDDIHSFQYDVSWLKSNEAFDLSLQLPRRAEPFGNRITLSFFGNLLPEGDTRHVLEKNHQISGAFQTLQKYGEDCAGAVILSSSPSPPKAASPETEVLLPLKDVEVALDKGMVVDLLAKNNPGYLSLAGAQDKFPCIVRDNTIYLPTSGQPTTHIIKPPIRHPSTYVKETVYNEYYCMRLAKAVGLSVSEVFILQGQRYPLFVTKRFDRRNVNNRIQRLHIQDFCQAKGLSSEKKYQIQGGLSFSDCYQLIKDHVHIRKKNQNLFELLDWLSFNLLIGNNDSHSKNISFILSNNRYELTPFYDLLCTSIYPTLQTNFAFSIGGRWDMSCPGIKHFSKFEEDLQLKSGTMLSRLQKMYSSLQEHKDNLAMEVHLEFPQCKIAKRIAQKLDKRAKGFRTVGLRL